MTKVNLSYPDFSAGELSPRMYGRFDLPIYYAGSRRVENFIPQTTGPAYFRAGTTYANGTRDNEKAFMWTFNFSDVAVFALEFTAGYVRFYTGSGLVTEDAQDITGITQASPAVVTYSGADNYSNGDRVIIEGVAGMTELNNREFEVANVDTGANTFELSGEDSSAYTAYSSDGTVKVVTEVITPYTVDDLFDLKFAQNGVDLYIVHPSHNPKKLTYTSATSWAITDHSPTGLTLTADDRPSAVAFYEQRLIYGGSNNSPQTLYFSKSGDVDDFTTGTEVDDGIEYTVVGGGRIEWLRGTEDFLAIGAFQDVLKATGGIDDVITPTSISVKPTNSYGVDDVNPIGKGSQIFYMQKNSLIMRSLEYDLTQDSFFPADRNVVADHITETGVSQITFQEGRPNVVWGVRNDGALIGMTLEDSESVSGWHRHNTEGSFISLTAMPRVRDYDQMWFCVARTVGGATKYYIEFLEDQPVFTRREDYVGDTDTEAADQALYENVLFEQQRDYIFMDSALTFDGLLTGSNAGATLTPAAATGTGITFTASTSVFTADDVGKRLWRKSITGVETGIAEITAQAGTTATCDIVESFDSTTPIPAGEWFLTTDSVSGLSHLEGLEVTVLADGGQHPKRTVTNGSISLTRQVGKCHVGLGYVGYLETNDMEGGGLNGTAQTKRKSLNALGFRFLDSLYASYGTDYYNLQQVEERRASMKMDRPPLVFTGDKKETFTNKINDVNDAGWNREKRAIISQSLPFPCNVQLVIPYINVSNV